MTLTLVFLVILVALVFEYINGFHDTANSIATVVSTKVLTPRQAIVMAAVTNLVGALVGTAVAKTIASGIVDAQYVSSQVLICALLGAITWNLITWFFGLPSSSSHALVGGLCGAALAASHGNWSSIKWIETKQKMVEAIDPVTHEKIQQMVTEKSGILYKVIVPMVCSPLIGLVVGFVLMGFLYYFLRNWRPATVSKVFGPLQLFSSAAMGWSHGMNDAQKTMGIIALALAAATKAGTLDHLPEWLSFLHTPEVAGVKAQPIATWIKVVCAATMAAGTAAGGWRIIKTLGHKMVRLQPVNGFAAEATGATVIGVAALMGMPVSTTHAVTASIMGVGAARRFNALKFNVIERILWAWILTLPMAALVSYVLVRLLEIFQIILVRRAL